MMGEVNEVVKEAIHLINLIRSNPGVYALHTKLDYRAVAACEDLVQTTRLRRLSLIVEEMRQVVKDEGLSRQ